MIEDDLAEVIVSENQFSLAVGRGGQNVRLAARLTGVKIDIKKKEDSEDKNNETSEEDENSSDDIVE
jgi:N utilization substance protein A